VTHESVTEQESGFLRQAIDLARAAKAHGAHPFGSLIVDEHGQVIVTARNNAVRPSATHATRRKTRLLQSRQVVQRSRSQQMYAIHQRRAMPMCAGAIYWTASAASFTRSHRRAVSLHRQPRRNSTMHCLARILAPDRNNPGRGPFIEEEAGHQKVWTNS